MRVVSVDDRQADLRREVAAFFADTDVADLTTLYLRLLDEDPVHRSDVGLWIVTSHALARTVITSKDFAREGQGMYGSLTERGPAQELWASAIVTLDEPNHTRLRSLAAHGFSTRSVNLLQAKAELAVGRRLGELRPTGQMELLADFSYPYTLEMICSMLGVPDVDGPLLMSWTQALVSIFQPRCSVDQREAADDAARGLVDYFGRLADERAADPRDDMITAFVRAKDAESRLTRQELAALSAEMVVAGHETTANLIPNALLTLLRHPAELKRLRHDPSLIESAVEECLRFETPVRFTIPSVATRDVTLGDTVIPKGSRVVVWYAAANRDPAVFDEPDRFDITRSPNRHLSFSGGMHFCLGNALARMETRVAIAGLIALPNLRLRQPDVRWRSDWPTSRNLVALDVDWDDRTTCSEV